MCLAVTTTPDKCQRFPSFTQSLHLSFDLKKAMAWLCGEKTHPAYLLFAEDAPVENRSTSWRLFRAWFSSMLLHSTQKQRKESRFPGVPSIVLRRAGKPWSSWSFLSSNIAQNGAMIHKNHDVVLKLVYELLSRQDNKYQLHKSFWLQLVGAGLSEFPAGTVLGTASISI